MESTVLFIGLLAAAICLVGGATLVIVGLRRGGKR